MNDERRHSVWEGIVPAEPDPARVAAASMSRVGAPPASMPPGLVPASGPASGPATVLRGGRGAGALAAAERRSRVEALFPVPTDPGVFSWIDAADVTRQAAMQRLDRFVEWLCATFALHEVLTPCWSRHPAIVVELWALERHYVAAYVEGDDKNAPARWLNQLAATRARLNTEWRARNCEYGHTDPVAEAVGRVRERREHYAADYWPTGELPGTPDGGFVWQRWAWPPTDESLAPIVPPDYRPLGSPS